MTVLPETIAEGFGKWRAVILTVAQFGEPGDNGCEVARIGSFQVIEKFTHGASSIFSFVKLYGKVHAEATSILM